MRSCVILALFGLTVACGSNDDAGEGNGPSIAVETAVVNTVTATDTTTDSNMPEPPTFRTTVLVPTDSEIKNEGDVLLEVRTAEGERDPAWVAETSGYPEVDEFALDDFLTDGNVIKFGWGDPPYQMMVNVRIPIDANEGVASSENETPEGSTPILLPVTIPPESEISNEGDVFFEVKLVEELIDSVWVVQSSGYPEVDEFAMEHLMSLKESGHYFSLDPVEQSLLFRLIIRQHSGSDVE